MTPETSLSDAQILKIFRHHKLAQNPKIERINIGFSNEVHQVDDYILKLYLTDSGPVNYRREASLYERLNGKALTPQLVVSDGSTTLANKPYIIYKMIAGEPLGYHWHKLSDSQRKDIIKTLCEQIRIIAALDPNPKLGRPWQAHVKMHIDKALATVEQKQLLPSSQIAKFKDFARLNLPAVKKEVIGFIYWDVHLDNIVVRDGKIVGMVDFEHVDPVSIDYLLWNIQRLVNYPQLTLSEKMEKYADKKDYVHLMAWFKEFYPELFDFPQLEKRLQLYELEAVLRLLPRFPNAKQLHKRLNTLLSVR